MTHQVPDYAKSHSPTYQDDCHEVITQSPDSKTIGLIVCAQKGVRCFSCCLVASFLSELFQTVEPMSLSMKVNLENS